MGESKQVKVDNWGIFFLQRLQHYFNKTYFCDLTLQFEDNVQLKVHRLVVNACTEYFQMLEQTCEVINDCIIMPPELQADVVVPIVNFMYTGILEFQDATFSRLYAAAQLMNMTVLTKLLDAQKVPISPIPKPTNKRTPVTPITWNLQGKKIAPKTMDPDLPEPLPGRKLPIWKRKSVPSSVLYRSTEVPSIPDPLSTKYFKSSVDDTPKPTRFEWPDDDDNTFDTSSFDEISYTSKPIILPTREKSPKPSTSNFEELKKTSGSVKRSASPVYHDSKRLNIQDVKEYLKEQKLRSDYIDYDDAEAADNDLQTYNDDDSADEAADKNGVFDQNTDESPSKSILKSDTSAPHNKRVRFSLEEKENTNSKTTAKTNETATKSDQPPTDMSNHTKIITEVLKKYPHLVKKNKNIRLKILAKGAASTANNAKPANSSTTVAKPTSKVSYMVMKSDQNKNTSSLSPEKKDGHWSCHKCSNPNPLQFETYYLYRKHLTDVHQEKFDSQMCNICGHQSRKQNMLVYHKYVKHGIDPPAMYHFPTCKECSYVALSQTLLVKHQYNHTHGNLMCTHCATVFTTKSALISHIQLTGHSNKTESSGYDCTYCNRKFNSEETLYLHMKSHHQEDGLKDGLISAEETEVEKQEPKTEQLVSHTTTEKPKEKIKILSNVKVNKTTADLMRTSAATTSTQKETNTEKQKNKTDTQALEPSSEAESLSNVASGIAASLGLVNTIVVLDDNQFILQPQENNQENSTTNEQQEYILPEIASLDNMSNLHVSQHQVMTSENNAIISQAALNKANITSTDELVMVLTDHDYSDASNNAVLAPNSSNIVVLYSHPVQGQDGPQYISQQGNIMLNADMGLMEVDDHYNVSNGIPTLEDKQCEESIEMIQQEINSQLETDITQNVHAEQTNKILEEEVVTFTDKMDIVNDQVKTTPDVTNEVQNEEVEEKSDMDPINMELQSTENETASAATSCEMNVTENTIAQFEETEESIELIQKEINSTSDMAGTSSNNNVVDINSSFTTPVECNSQSETKHISDSTDVLDSNKEVENSTLCTSHTDSNEAKETQETHVSIDSAEVIDKCSENDEALLETNDSNKNRDDEVCNDKIETNSEDESKTNGEENISKTDEPNSNVENKDSSIVETLTENPLQNDTTQESVILTEMKTDLVSEEPNLDDSVYANKDESLPDTIQEPFDAEEFDKGNEQLNTELKDMDEDNCSKETDIPVSAVAVANKISEVTEKPVSPTNENIPAEINNSNCNKVSSNESVLQTTNSKISNLLDDWDDGDTDSQQSDTLKSNAETVSSINTLINDWDDEEDT